MQKLNLNKFEGSTFKSSEIDCVMYSYWTGRCEIITKNKIKFNWNTDKFRDIISADQLLFEIQDFPGVTLCKYF